MTRELHVMGLLGMGIILITLGIAALREDDRQAEAALEQREVAVIAGTELFAENCVICHGAAGEGIAANPALDSEGVRGMDETALYNTIDRGRYGTTMAAFGVDEGGILTSHDIQNLMTLIQYGAWDYVATVVDEKGLTPPELVSVEISDDVLASIGDLPDGDILGTGLTIYAENCVACHGANLEGSAIAPALAPTSLSYDDMTRIIQTGVTGTVMAGWGNVLSESDINALLSLITRWEEVQNADIEIPVIEAPPIDMSPAAIAQGEQLYSLLCTQCHGAAGYGTPLAPALNNLTFLSQTPDAAIMQIIAGGVPGTTMPSWAGYLNDADIAAITAYLRAWEPTAPPMAAP